MILVKENKNLKIENVTLFFLTEISKKVSINHFCFIMVLVKRKQTF